MADLITDIVSDLRATQKQKKTDTQFGILGVDKFASEPAEYLTTGVSLLDWAITGRSDRPGLAVGRVVEIFGPESCGKSLLLLNILGHAQRAGHVAGLTDTERAEGVEFATGMGGVDPSSLLISYARTVEGVLDAISDSITSVRKKTKAYREAGMPEPVYVHGLDSWAGLCTRDELTVRMDRNSALALRARQLKLWMTKEIDRISDDRVVLIATNHEIANIGNPMNPTTTPGGGGWRFFASTRVALRAVGRITVGVDREALGIWVRARVVKNRFDLPYREALFPILFRTGIDDELALVNYCFRKGELGSTKGYATWKGKKYRERDLAQLLREQPAEREELRALAAELFGSVGDIEESPDVVEGV